MSDTELIPVSPLSSEVVAVDVAMNDLVLLTAGMLSGSTTHEVNNPLTYVLGNLEFVHTRLSKFKGSPDLAELRQALAEASAGATRVREVMSLFAEVVRPRNMHSTSSPQIGKLVEQLLRLTSVETKRRVGVRVELEDPAAAVGDDFVTRQVLLHLLLLAVRAFEKAEELCLRGREAREGYTLEMVGPASGDVPAGYGLRLCAQLLGDRGDELSMLLEQGSFAGFQLLLHPQHAGSQARLRTAPALRRPRLMVIDDDAQVNRALCRMLSARGVVDGCLDPLEALELLTGPTPYDLVFCDMRLGELSGADLFRRVEAQVPGATRFVFMTGAPEEFGPFFRQVNAISLDKPFTSEAVMRLLDKLLP